MDPELLEIIALLNPKLQKPKFRVRVRSSKPPAFPKQKVRQNSAISIKPNRSSAVLQKPLDQNLLQDINDFYRQEDEVYIQQLNQKIGAPILWMRHQKKEIKGRKYLEFRPYIDLMSIRPPPAEDRGYYYKMQNSDVKLIKYLLEDNGFLEAGGKSQWTFMWHGGVIKPATYQALTKYQKVNHFPRTVELTRKDLMYKNIYRMQTQYGLRHFGFVPKTFLLPQDIGELEYQFAANGGTWIVKPSASSQGKGIFLATRFSDIPKKDHVVSRYIDNPLLIDGLKFDLRIYVGITSIHPLRVYIYKQGLVRFATSKYQNNNKGNRFMHLTNYSVNKLSNNFKQNTSAAQDNIGSKWSLSALKALFQEKNMDFDRVFDKIKDIVIKSILSIESHLYAGFQMHVPYRTNCFQLLGFDILIDDTLTPWLLEVNLSPSLNCDSPLDQKIKGALISDIFTLSGIVSLDYRNNLRSSQLKSSCYHSLQAPPIRKKGKKTQWNFNTKPHQAKKEASSKEQREILKQTNSELTRRGNFERIFPSEVSVNYKQFFQQDRPFNVLLCNQFGKIHRKGQGGSAIVYRKPRIA